MVAEFRNKALNLSSLTGHDFMEEGDGRVLIVDDDEPMQELFASCLGDRDSCVTATDATEATVRLASARAMVDGAFTLSLEVARGASSRRDRHNGFFRPSGLSLHTSDREDIC